MEDLPIPLTKDYLLTMLRHFKGLVSAYEKAYKQIEEQESFAKDAARRERISQYDFKTCRIYNK